MTFISFLMVKIFQRIVLYRLIFLFFRHNSLSSREKFVLIQMSFLSLGLRAKYCSLTHRHIFRNQRHLDDTGLEYFHSTPLFWSLKNFFSNPRHKIASIYVKISEHTYELICLDTVTPLNIQQISGSFNYEIKKSLVSLL